MAHYMVNIPRRMIYETMLEFEDALLGIEVLAYGEHQFEEFKTDFVENSLPKLQRTYDQIKALLIMFFENETFSTKEAFNAKLHSYLEKMDSINKTLKNDDNLPEEFKKTLPVIDEIIIDPHTLVKDFESIKSHLELLDQFNQFIPKILEIRRDEMK